MPKSVFTVMVASTVLSQAVKEMWPNGGLGQTFQEVLAEILFKRKKALKTGLKMCLAD